MGSGYGQNNKAHRNNATNPLAPAELTAYYDEFNEKTGGGVGAIARGEGQRIAVQPLSAQDIRAAAGVNATGQAQAQNQNAQALERVGSDSNLTAYQRFAANQQADQALLATTDSLGKNTESAIQSLVSDEHQRKYEIERFNAAQALQELLLVSEAYSGGKGRRFFGYDKTKARSFQGGGGMGSGGNGKADADAEYSGSFGSDGYGY